MLYLANYWAILVAALATFMIGGLWYSPVLFGKHWMKAVGMTEAQAEEMKKKGEGKKSMFFGFFVGLITAYILGYFIELTAANELYEGLKIAFWLWLGFAATIQIGAVLWEGKSMKLFFINTSYSLVTWLIMGAILAVWK